MPKSKAHDIPDVQASDPAESMRKFEDFTRKILAVPKKEIDAKLAREKARRENNDKR